MDTELDSTTGANSSLSCTTPVLSVSLRRDDLRAVLSRHILLGVERVVIGRDGERALRSGPASQQTLTLGLGDGRVSGTHAELRLRQRRWWICDLHSSNGTLLNGQRLMAGEPHAIEDGDSIAVGRTTLVLRLNQPFVLGSARLDAFAHQAGLAEQLDTWRTFHLPLAQTYRDLARFARSSLPVLIQGPTGAGKERVAAGVHALSNRSGPFVPVNCAAIPEHLIESELFGHARGAFTGAGTHRVGLFRKASGGTLFLDEVGELSPAVQAKLLRVLQDGTVRPVGHDISEPVDVRIVSATHQDLSESSFRDDLRYRLSGFVAQVPGLAARIEDIGLMLSEMSGPTALTFDAHGANLLVRHAWPGGARELNLMVQRLEVVADGRVASHHIADLSRGPRPNPAPVPPVERSITRHQLEAALRAARGNVTQAAAILGCQRQSVYRSIKKHGIDLKRFR